MSDKDKKLGDLDNLDGLDSSNHAPGQEYSEYDEAIASLSEEEDESLVEVENVEDNSGKVVEFEEEDEDEDESNTSSGRKSFIKNAVMLSAVILGASTATYFAGVHFNLIGGHKSSHSATPPSHENDTFIVLDDKDSKSKAASDNKAKEVADNEGSFTTEEVESKPKPKSNALVINLDKDEPVETKPVSKPEIKRQPEAKMPVVEDEGYLNVGNDQDLISEINVKLNNVNNNTVLLNGVNTGINQIKQSESDHFDMLIAKINKLTDLSRADGKSKVVEVEKELPRLSFSEKKSLIKNRSRIPGYSVISTSVEGDMSIVRSVKYGKERISVFFKGEKMIVSGKGVLNVQEIKDSGHLALVGNRYFMDDTYIPYIASSDKKTSHKKESKKESKKEVAKKEHKKAPMLKKKPEQKSQVVTGSIAKPIAFKSFARGWKLNGVYPDGFLIESPTGEWITKVVGESIPEMGIVQGLDDSGNLIVDKFLIKLVKLPN
ncbi:hypothetical protein [Psychromonas sp. SP041]|uniref:hypothetical protein n=1 Tax=Psychromonas sp. SP041 TaxID=1365007 RepID=UPI0010C77D64|nr:hypothetical protein [Psychromonas sp. SP041]